TMTTERLAAEDLVGFRGTENYWQHWTKRLVYTDGVRYVAQRGGAYWLIDAVASHQADPIARQEPFQVWVLSRLTGNAAALEMNDGNTERAIIRQEIEFTDFPLDSLTLYLTDGVLMLPGEY